jgi:hypothetical protein
MRACGSLFFNFKIMIVHNCTTRKITFDYGVRRPITEVFQITL